MVIGCGYQISKKSGLTQHLAFTSASSMSSHFELSEPGPASQSEFSCCLEHFWIHGELFIVQYKNEYAIDYVFLRSRELQDIGVGDYFVAQTKLSFNHHLDGIELFLQTLLFKI